MRKILFTLIIMAFCSIASGVGTQKQIQFVDEWGEPVNMGTDVSLYIYDVTTTDEQTCYTNNTGHSDYLVTQPVEDDSANTVIDYTTGLMTFWSQKAGYKLTVTDGTYTRTIDNLHGGITRFGWPSYLVAMSARTVSDAQTWAIGSETDVTFDWDNDNSKLTITETNTEDSEIEIGNNTYQFDVQLFADTDDDYVMWDNSDESWEYVGAQAHFDDDSFAWFGTHKDFSLSSSTTKQLWFLPLVGDETYEVHIGGTGAGADLKVWGSGTDYIVFDAGDDYLHMVGDKVLFTLAEAAAANVFKVDATGASGDLDVIVFETSDGGVLINADGADAGDITFEAADVLTMTVADDLTATVTGTTFIDGTDDVKITSSKDAASAILLTVDGGNSSTLKLHADAGTGQDAVHVLIDDGGMTVTATAAIDDGAILYVTGMVDTASQLWGGIYADINIGDGVNADTTDGPVYAVSGILWPQASAAPADIIAGGKFGVNETSADLSGATVVGILIENSLAAAGSDPLNHYMMYFNCLSTGETPDYWFYSTGKEAIAFEENIAHGAAATDKIGAIKIGIGGYGTCYLYVYDHAGQ